MKKRGKSFFGPCKRLGINQTSVISLEGSSCQSGREKKTPKKAHYFLRPGRIFCPNNKRPAADFVFFCLSVGKKGGEGKELKAERPDGKTNVVGSFNNNSRARLCSRSLFGEYPSLFLALASSTAAPEMVMDMALLLFQWLELCVTCI